ncbi:Six-hairpin glycosidase-like protein [Xylariales sp. PMI_506]|nr:Six-hairpin glycosidase-like protein [Xylariales sp. PMI_506]
MYSVSLYSPVGLVLGSQRLSFSPFEINTSVPSVILDYGHEVAGYPVFDIESISGHVQIEVKYSEDAQALQNGWSDGPFPMTVALSNTYRVETFEINQTGRVEAYLLQGGQRWESIQLLTDGQVTFSGVGFIPSVSVTDIDNLPGGFTSSDESLNEIWKAGSQKAIWEVSEENGAYVRGMRPAVTSAGVFFEDYTLEFDAKIDVGGLGWTVAFPIASPAKGIQLNLVANEQTFVNTNTTLMRPNSVLFGYGYSFVNVTTLTSWHLDTFDVPFTVELNQWYHIKTVLDGTNLAVFIQDTPIFNVSLSSYYVGDSILLALGLPIPSEGSFGFGGWQDQSAYFKNVTAFDTANGSEIYRNSFTDASETGVIREYGVHANYESVCLDGAKRDRLIWLGDFFHTVRVVAASTSRFDILKDTFSFLLQWQVADGPLPYDSPMGYDPGLSSDAFARGGASYYMGEDVYNIILSDYQILGILSFTDYIRKSNDLEFARATWSQWKLLIEWVYGNIDSSTGLLSLFSSFLGAATGGSADNCALVQALKEMTDIANALGETSDGTLWSGIQSSLVTAVNDNLWNETLGVYGLSPSDPTDYSINSIAFCITSGTASTEQAERLISALPALRLGPGYKDSTTASSSDPTVNISPNTNGFLLSALLSMNSTNAATAALDLMKSLWSTMLSNENTTTGASWEYVNQQGNPGLGFFTSLSHPWGGAPTYILTEYAAGIQTTQGSEGFGYCNWVLSPSMGVAMGLTNATASVVTAFGGTLRAQWKITDGVMDVSIDAPSSTNGSFELSNITKTLQGSDYYSFSITI